MVRYVGKVHRGGLWFDRVVAAAYCGGVALNILNSSEKLLKRLRPGIVIDNLEAHFVVLQLFAAAKSQSKKRVSASSV